MYLPNHENGDRLWATGEVFVYANRFGRRADRWQVSQCFWRVFVESKTRISDRMTKNVWPRESEAYSLWGIKHIGRLAAKIVRNLFRQIFDAKNLNAPPVKSMLPTGLAEYLQSGNAPDSVVGYRMSATFSTDFRCAGKPGYLTSWRKSG